MVVAVQCPEPRCRKYQLVEDHERGNVVPCLICKSPIRVASPGPNDVPAHESGEARERNP